MWCSGRNNQAFAASRVETVTYIFMWEWKK